MAGSFIGRIKVLLGLDSGQFSKGIEKGKKEMSGFQKFSKSWAGKMTGLLAGVFAINTIKDFTVEAVKLAGEMQGVKSAFQGLNDPALLDKLRAATKGTVSDLELMKNAVKAKNLGVPVQQLGTFFEFARRRAKETGESVEFLTESIVTGIGRKSPLILDNLGISASALSEEFKRTGDFGKAAANIVESELAKMGADIDTTAESTAKLSASWENYMTVLGGQSTGIINAVSKSLNELLTSITETDRVTADAAKLGFDRKAFSDLDAATQKYVAFNAKVAMNTAVFAENETSINKLRAAMRFFKEEADKVDRGTDEGRVKLISYSESMAVLQKRINNLTSKKGLPSLTEEEERAALAARRATLNIDALKESVGELNFRGGDKAISGLVDDIKKLDELNKPLTLHVPAKLDLQFTDTSEANEKITGKMIQLGEMASEGLTQALQGSAGLLVDGLASAFEGAGMDDIAGQFLQGFADILQQFGKMLITLGLGLQAFQASLSTLNPAVAIGAGVALLAIAGGIKSFLQNSAKGGGQELQGSSGGGRGGYVSGLKNYQNPQSGGQGEESIQFRIQGKDLVALSGRYNKTNTLTT